MADVITFKVTVEELDNKIWREIQFSSLSTIADLSYAILSTFETTGTHLFSVEFGEQTYEFVFDCDGEDDEDVIAPNEVKLKDLNLKENDTISMIYDFGNNWEFTITVEKIEKMITGTSSRYPYIVDGKGKGIVDDMFSDEVKNLIEYVDENNKPANVEVMFGHPYKWDYRDFLLGSTNVHLKSNMKKLKQAYEG